MESCYTLIRGLLAIEAILFVPALPAWGQLLGASTAMLLILLSIGVFCGLALFAIMAGRPSWRMWAWAAAITNLLVFPTLTPAGLTFTFLLVAVDWNLAGFHGDFPRRVSSGANGRTWVVWLVCLLLCWAGAWQVHVYATREGVAVIHPLLMFTGLAALAPVSLKVHRFGRWLAGLSVGLCSFEAQFAGWRDLQPAVRDGKAWRQRMLVWVIGGPLASLAFGVAGIAVFLFGAGRFWANYAELSGLAGICSLVVCFTSMLPWRYMGIRSDGAVLLSIARRRSEYKRDKAVAMLAGEWQHGVRPGNWDPLLLGASVAVPDISRQHATGCAFNYLYCLDRGYNASARFWIGRLAAEFAGEQLAVPPRWRLEIAFHLAAFDGSGRLAEAPSWRRAVGRTRGDLLVPSLRCDAALALSRGDAKAAGEFVARAERSILGNLDERFLEFEWDLLDSLRERLNPAVAERPLPAPVPMVAPIAV